MKFYFDNGTYALRNMGDVAMLQVAYSRFTHRWPDAEVVIQTDDAHRLETFLPNSIPCPDRSSGQWKQLWNLLGGLHKLVPKSLHDELRFLEAKLRMKFPNIAKGIIRSRLKRRGESLQFEPFLSHIQKSNAVIATGGGYIADEFENHALSILETLGLAASMGLPVAMFGQGIGPIQSPRLRRLAAQVLPRVNLIALREGRCGPSLLEQLGVKTERVVITGDDAIELAAKVPTSSQNGVGFNLRVAGYSDIDSLLSKQIANEVRSFALQKSVPIYPIPISMNEGESDSVSLKSILDWNDQENSELASLETPQSVIEQVGRCRVVITASYHAGVFALSKGIPVVGLIKSSYYQDKFRGLQSQFQQGCEMVDLNSLQWKTELMQKASLLWDECPDLRNRLQESILTQTRHSQSAYDRFFEIVEATE